MKKSPKRPEALNCWGFTIKQKIKKELKYWQNFLDVIWIGTWRSKKEEKFGTAHLYQHMTSNNRGKAGEMTQRHSGSFVPHVNKKKKNPQIAFI